MAVPETYQQLYTELNKMLNTDLNAGGADALNKYYEQTAAQANKAYGVNGPVDQTTYDNYYNKYLNEMNKQYGVTGPVTQDTYNKYYNENLSKLKSDYGIKGDINYDTYQNYYNNLSQQLLKDIGQIEYNPRSTGTIKSALQQVIRPSYQKSIQNRQEATKANRAAIDADAAARGIGASTWVTDAKQRQMSNEARDIANINSDYNSALYSALMNQLGIQDQLSMNAQQANMSARQNALGNAMSGANYLYGSDLEKLNNAISNATSRAGTLYSGALSNFNNALSAALSQAQNMYSTDVKNRDAATQLAYQLAQGLYSTDANARSQAISAALQAAQYLNEKEGEGGGGGGGGGGSGSGGGKEQTNPDYGSENKGFIQKVADTVNKTTEATKAAKAEEATKASQASADVQKAANNLVKSILQGNTNKNNNMASMSSK